MTLFFLCAFALLLLVVALALAWILGVTLFHPQSALARRIVDRSDLVRAHVDYLMMAQFLLIFFLAFRYLAVTPPAWLVGFLCLGAFLNPLAFVARALTGKPQEAPPAGFPLPALVSVSATTIGFLGAAALILLAGWRAL